jgi:hypothetical protein
MALKKVTYEVAVNMGGASMIRLMRGLCFCDGELRQHYITGDPPHYRYSSVIMMVRLPPQYSEMFQRDVRPDYFQYKSPTRFNWGTIEPLYKTPEEEIADGTPAAKDA